MININIWCFEIILTVAFLLRPELININIWCFEINDADGLLDDLDPININIWCFEILHLLEDKYRTYRLISTYGVLKYIFPIEKPFLCL